MPTQTDHRVWALWHCALLETLVSHMGFPLGMVFIQALHYVGLEGKTNLPLYMSNASKNQMGSFDRKLLKKSNNKEKRKHGKTWKWTSCLTKACSYPNLISIDSDTQNKNKTQYPKCKADQTSTMGVLGQENYSYSLQKDEQTWPGSQKFCLSFRLCLNLLL